MGKPRFNAGLLRTGVSAMSDRVKLAREIAARTEPRFSDTTKGTKDLKDLAREIAARTQPRFVSIPRDRGGGKVPFTEEQLTVMRGGLTVEEYRRKTIRKWGKR
jgi:hypothetical protein